MFAVEKRGKIPVEVIEVEIFEAGFTDKFELVLLRAEFLENGSHKIDVIGFATRNKPLIVNEFLAVVFEIIQNNVVFASEMAIERRPPYSRLARDVGYADFVERIILHKLEQRLHDIEFRVFFLFVHDTISPFSSHRAEQTARDRLSAPENG